MKNNTIKVISAIFILSGFVIILPFVIPLISRSGVTGSLLGIALGGYAILLGVFFPYIRKRAKRAVKIIYDCLMYAFFLVIVYIIIASGFMLNSMLDSPPANCPDTVIVLGCQVKNGKPSLMLQRRIDAAYEYLIRNEDALCVGTWGTGEGEEKSEGQVIVESLIQMGIDKDRLIIEDRATSTEENIRYSIEKADIKERAVIVTDGFHQLRAEIIAGKYGIDTYSVPAATPGYLIAPYWLRDCGGVAFTLLFG